MFQMWLKRLEDYAVGESSYSLNQVDSDCLAFTSWDSSKYFKAAVHAIFSLNAW